MQRSDTQFRTNLSILMEHNSSVKQSINVELPRIKSKSANTLRTCIHSIGGGLRRPTILWPAGKHVVRSDTIPFECHIGEF